MRFLLCVVERLEERKGEREGWVRLRAQHHGGSAHSARSTNLALSQRKCVSYTVSAPLMARNGEYIFFYPNCAVERRLEKFERDF